MKTSIGLEKNFIGSKYLLLQENTVELQALRERIYRDAKVKTGAAYQNNARISFQKALDAAESDGDTSYENVLSNFLRIN